MISLIGQLISVGFLVASLLMLLFPGPAVFYIVGSTMESGARAGILSALGVASATTIHVVAAAAGFSVLLTLFPTALDLVRYAGAFYLIYLGVASISRMVKNKAQNDKELKNWYWRGMVVGILNPKTILFMLAFLPQFVNEAVDLAVGMQMLILGLVFVMMGAISDSLYAVVSAHVASAVRENSKLISFFRYGPGAMFIVLGVFLLFNSSS